MLTRASQLAALEGSFDLVIIGGGINGAGVARDAALRGLRVALIEQRDLASGTSSRSSKLVHGGLRYLQQAQIGLVFESVNERRTLQTIAPHLVRPLGFLFPVYRGDTMPVFVVAFGMFLYEALCFFRTPGRRRTLGVSTVRHEEPALRLDGLRGAPLYFDCATDDARLTLETALDARAAGAVIVPWMAATGVRRDEQGRITHVEARSTLTGESRAIATGAVVNAGGPWVDALLRDLDASQHPILRPTKGVHIVVPAEKLPLTHAVVMRHPADRRVLFGIPWGDATYIGTTDTDWSGDLNEVHTDAWDVAYLLESTDAYFPQHRLRPSDIVSTWAGLRPLMGPPPGKALSASQVSREHHIDTHPSGVVTVAGGKLTTYRLMSAEVVDAAVTWLHGQGRLAEKPARPDTGRRTLPGGGGWNESAGFRPHADAALAAGAGYVEEDTAWLLATTYGARAPEVAARVARDPALGTRIVEGRPEILAQVDYGMDEELLLTLGDALKQRTQLYYRASCQGLSGIPRVAPLMAAKLGWDQAETARQIAAYEAEVSSSRAWQDGIEAALAERRTRRQALVPGRSAASTAVEAQAAE
jgi:glycerol-3-phosphate dehydrogenase